MKIVSALLTLALVVLVPTIALTCPFCQQQTGPTFAEDFSKAEIVVLGTFTNATKGGKLSDSSTEFAIEQTIKDHPLLKGKKSLTLPRYLQPSKEKFLIFCDVYKNELDPYRAIPLASESTMVKYLTGATAIETHPAGEKLRYYFDYLNSPETEIGLDAYRQFAKAPYSDYAEMAKKLPADTIAAWMRDPKTPAYRLGLYASLLGHCGKAEHAALLRKMIDDPEIRRSGGGVDGMMAGLVMIDPTNWEHVDHLMLDPKQEFQLRYSAFRTARFFWDIRPDLVPKATLDKSVANLMQDHEMSDFAIDELRRWQRWEHTKEVLDLFNKKSHNLSVIKRAILRFALQSPEQSAKTFVAQQRSRDAGWVTDTEELLKAETGAK
jgi:hypothetical protein